MSFTSSRADGPQDTGAVWFIPLVLCATAAGLYLRVAGASNDLWVDEVWSLDLGLAAPSLASVFWGLSHDNSHTLNTVWLRLIGDGASPLLYRSPAILCGAATCLVAARLARRHGGPAAGVFAAVLFATGLLFVNYGSEARGYGPMMFGLLAAADALDEWTRGDRRAWVAVRLCGGLALASFSHLLALPAAAILGLIAAAALWRRTPEAAHLVAIVARLAALFGAGLAPATACFLAGVAVTGGFARHAHEPYSLAGHLTGLAANLQLFILPLWLPPGAAFLLGAGLFAVALTFVRRELRLAYIAAALGSAGLAALLQAEDPQYPRFHMPFSLVFALLIAIGFGEAWRMGGWRRGAVGALFAGAVLLNLAEVALLPERGRGQPRKAIEIMTQDGPATYLDLIEGSAALRLRHYINLDRRPLERILPADVCKRAIDWVVNTERRDQVTPIRRIDGPGCAADYEFVAYLWSGRVSGHPFTLYRRVANRGEAFDEAGRPAGQ